MSENELNEDLSLEEFYFIGETIGEGTFGKVKNGTHRLTKENVAIKILEKSKISDESDIVRIERELAIMQKLKHKNIILLYEVFETKDALYLIMEYASKGELFGYIIEKQRLSEKEACIFFHQILDGIEYMHKNGVAHRDLKPENILLSSSSILKIIDFGLGTPYSKNSLLKTACGSPCYASPEMLQGNHYNSLKSDIWSAGIIFYAMICGFLPFEDSDTKVLYEKIKEGKFEIPDFLSADAVKFLNLILVVDPKKRPGIEKIRRNSWFKQFRREVQDENLYANQMDSEILEQMKNIGLNVAKTKESLDNNLHNGFTATYYLLLKKKEQKMDHLKDFLQKALDPSCFQIPSRRSSAPLIKNESFILKKSARLKKGPKNYSHQKFEYLVTFPLYFNGNDVQKDQNETFIVHSFQSVIHLTCEEKRNEEVAFKEFFEEEEEKKQGKLKRMKIERNKRRNIYMKTNNPGVYSIFNQQRNLIDNLSKKLQEPLSLSLKLKSQRENNSLIKENGEIKYNYATPKIRGIFKSPQSLREKTKKTNKYEQKSEILKKYTFHLSNEKTKKNTKSRNDLYFFEFSKIITLTFKDPKYIMFLLEKTIKKLSMNIIYKSKFEVRINEKINFSISNIPENDDILFVEIEPDHLMDMPFCVQIFKIMNI